MSIRTLFVQNFDMATVLSNAVFDYWITIEWPETIDIYYDFNKVRNRQWPSLDWQKNEWIWTGIDPSNSIVGYINTYQEAAPGVRCHVQLLSDKQKVLVEYDSSCYYDTGVTMWCRHLIDEKWYKISYINDHLDSFEPCAEPVKKFNELELSLDWE